MQDWIFKTIDDSHGKIFSKNTITAGLFLTEKSKVILGYKSGLVKIFKIDFTVKKVQENFSFQFEDQDIVRTITRFKDNSIIFIGTLNSGNFKIFDIDKNEILKEQEGIHDKYNRIFRSEWLNNKCYIIGSTFSQLNAYTINGDIQKQKIKTSGSNSTFGISCLNEKDIISGEYLGAIRLWTHDDPEFKLKKSIYGYRETIQAVTWHKSGEYFATLGKDGTIQIYKKYKENEEEDWILYLIYFSGSGLGNFISFSNDQSKIYVLTGSEVIIIDINTSGIYKYSFGPCVSLYELGEQFLIIHKRGIFLTKIEEPNLLLHEKINFAKVSIIGDAETGKSTLCNAIVKDNYDPTIKSTKMKTIWDWDIDKDPPLKIVFHDFGGQKNILPAHFPHLVDSDLIVIAFSQRDITSLEIAIELKNKLRNEYEYKKEIIFIRTKCDEEDFISEYLNDYNQKFPDDIINPLKTRLSDDHSEFIGSERVSREIIEKIEKIRPKGMLISNEIKELIKFIETEQDNGTEHVTYSDVYSKLEEDTEYVDRKKLYFTLNSLSIQGRIELRKRKDRLKLFTSGYEYDIYINMRKIFETKNKILQKAYSSDGVFDWNTYTGNFTDIEKEYYNIAKEMLESDNLCIDHGNQLIFLFFIKESLDENDRKLTESVGMTLSDENLILSEEFNKDLNPEPEDWIPYFLDLNLTILKMSKQGGIFYYMGLNAYCYVNIETKTNILSKVGLFQAYIGGKSPEIRDKLTKDIIEIYYKLFNGEKNHLVKKNNKSNETVNNRISLELGDNLVEKIKDGISKNDFGLVLISENFLQKIWKKNELDFLINLEENEGKIHLIFYKVEDKMINHYHKKFLNYIKRTYNTIEDLNNIQRYHIIEIIIENYNELNYKDKDSLIENLKFKDISREALESLIPMINIILFTAVSIERSAVLNYMNPLQGEELILRGSVGAHTYYIGIIGKYNIVLTMSGPGTSQRNGSLISCEHAFQFWNPKAAISCGIAFGINKSKRKIGDVLVSKFIIPYEIQRIGEKIIPRGGMPASSLILYNRIINAIDWKFYIGNKLISKIHGGSILSN